ncbi:hypothetical protein BH20ACI4_BH20ACI4_04820 [soil metagenome]
MNSIYKYAFLTIFGCLLFLQADAIAQEKSGGEPQKSTKNDVSKTDNSKFEFPQIEGWENGEIKKTPVGDMMNYDSEKGGRVTLYFYDGVLKGMPNKEREEVLKNEMTGAKIGILQLGEMGIYQNIKEAKKDETVMLGGKSGKVKSLHSLLYFSTKDDDLVSEIYVFSYKDHLFKIRASRSRTKENDNKALEKFFSELDARFSK